MFLLIDTADLKEIERAAEYFPAALAGVTTCPTIIVREKRKDFFNILKDIRSIIGDEKLLHAQVMGETAEEIVKDALAMRSAVTGKFYPKIPVTLEGYKAMGILRKDNVEFTATTIHTTSQAFLAASQGASFLAPYVNHIDDMGLSGATVVKEICDFVRARKLSAKVLAASFRNVRQIEDVLLAGAEMVTLDAPLLWKLAESPMTDASVKKFRGAWDSFYGKDKAVYNIE